VPGFEQFCHQMAADELRSSDNQAIHAIDGKIGRVNIFACMVFLGASPGQRRDW
jgi:hypothetical protein